MKSTTRVVVLLQAALLAAACSGQEVTRHPDGGGPLAYGGAVLSMSIPVKDGVDIYSFGAIGVCVLDGQPVVLSGVSPSASRGQVEYAGALAREFVYQEDVAMPVYKTSGWPPSLPGAIDPDSLEPLEGFVVDVPCGPEDRPASDRPVVEVMVGLRPLDRNGVVGWDAIELSYTRDGREYILEVDHGIYTCAEDMTNCEDIP